MSPDQMRYAYFITSKHGKYLQLEEIMSTKSENLVLGFLLENMSFQLSPCIRQPILLSTRQPFRHKATLRTAAAGLGVCARTSPAGSGLLRRNHPIPS